jgi:hypothetical protein
MKIPTAEKKKKKKEEGRSGVGKGGAIGIVGKGGETDIRGRR